MSQKFTSLATVSNHIELEISEIIDTLKEEVRSQSRVLDQGMVDIILQADDDVLDLLLSDFDPSLLWNLQNTTFGRGLLVGLLIAEVTAYFEALQNADEEGEKEFFDEANVNDKKNPKEKH
jgi:hypothetical protein